MVYHIWPHSTIVSEFDIFYFGRFVNKKLIEVAENNMRYKIGSTITCCSIGTDSSQNTTNYRFVVVVGMIRSYPIFKFLVIKQLSKLLIAVTHKLYVVSNSIGTLFHQRLTIQNTNVFTHPAIGARFAKHHIYELIQFCFRVWDVHRLIIVIQQLSIMVINVKTSCRRYNNNGR